MLIFALHTKHTTQTGKFTLTSIQLTQTGVSHANHSHKHTLTTLTHQSAMLVKGREGREGHAGMLIRNKKVC